MVKHWIEQIAIDHGHLLLRYLKLAEGRTDIEIEMLEKLFSNFNITPSDHVLDLCCGYGRHALRLAEKGYNVTGVDLSPILIDHGIKMAKKLNLEDRVEFILGDARNLLELLDGKSCSYHAIISMWSSLGYYNVETDRDILKQTHELSLPDGILILEMGNHDYYVKHFQPFGIESFDNIEIHEHRKLDLERSRLEQTWKVYKKEKNDLRYQTSLNLDMQLYSLHELIQLIESAGWNYLDSYGTLDLQPVTINKNRLLIVGKKRKGNNK